MRGLRLVAPGERVSVLFLGAHSDDIEIGVGGTVLEWIASGVEIDATWCVLSGDAGRRAEAEGAAAAFLKGARSMRLEFGQFRDSHFPYQGGEIKAWFESLKARVSPDLVFTHRREDAHQDHREVSRLTWNAFRDHLVLEYEIPKWDGDIGRPNVYMPLGSERMARKVQLLERHFGSQRSKDWFDADTFRGLARVRGMECRAPQRFAEAFVLRKAVLG